MNTNLLSLNPETEPRILVDLLTREVTIPEDLYKIGVTEDNNAETVYIQVADTYDGIPLDDKHVFVWFKNSKGEPYSLEIADIVHEENNLVIGWKIDERLTRYAGKVHFQLQFTASKYTLNTLTGEFEILAGLEKYKSAPPLENNVYEQLLRRISDLEMEIISLNSCISQISEINIQLTSQTLSIAEIKNEVKYLKENVVYIPL